MSKNLPFWNTIALTDMSTEQWESLCDGCGLCCLNKLENEDDGEIYYTNVACRLLETDHCKCRHYLDRAKHVEHCMILTPTNLGDSLRWLPNTCAYKRLAQKQSLPDWHPLLTGNANSVHAAGISACGRCVSETTIDLDEIEEHVVYWVDGFGE